MKFSKALLNDEAHWVEVPELGEGAALQLRPLHVGRLAEIEAAGGRFKPSDDQIARQGMRIRKITFDKLLVTWRGLVWEEDGTPIEDTPEHRIAMMRHAAFYDIVQREAKKLAGDWQEQAEGN